MMLKYQDDNLAIVANNPKKTGLTIEGYKDLMSVEDFNFVYNNKNKICQYSQRPLHEEMDNFNRLYKNEKFKALCYVKENLFN